MVRPCWLTVASLVLVGTGLAVALPLLASGSAASRVQLVAGVLACLPATAVGAFLTRLQPRNPVGPLLCAAGAILLWDVALTYPDVATLLGGVSAGEQTADVLEGAWMFLYVPYALLFLVFPDGRMRGRGSRGVAVGLVVVPVLFTVLLSGDSQIWSGLAIALTPVFLGLLVGSAWSVRSRYRGGSATTRIQLRWLLLASSTVPMTLLLCWLSYLLLAGPDLVVLGLFAMAVAVPAATTVAIVRHDLYDVDRAIIVTAAYGILSALLLAVFTTISIMAGILLAGDSTVPAVVVTALCAVALGPARRRLEDALRRRLYPSTHRALAALEVLRGQVHAGQARPEQVEAVLRTSLDDASLRVGVVVPGDTSHVGLDGAPLGPGQRQPVLLAGDPVGVLVSGPDVALPPPREVASAAALLLETVRLRAEQVARCSGRSTRVATG